MTLSKDHKLLTLAHPHTLVNIDCLDAVAHLGRDIVYQIRLHSGCVGLYLVYILFRYLFHFHRGHIIFFGRFIFCFVRTGARGKKGEKKESGE